MSQLKATRQAHSPVGQKSSTRRLDSLLGVSQSQNQGVSRSALLPGNSGEEWPSGSSFRVLVAFSFLGGCGTEVLVSLVTVTGEPLAASRGCPLSFSCGPFHLQLASASQTLQDVESLWLPLLLKNLCGWNRFTWVTFEVKQLGTIIIPVKALCSST